MAQPAEEFVTEPEIRRKRANAIRALAMDAVQKANSGHPGAPLGMADIAEVLWNDYFKHNPGNPAWPDRDRFVLSNGHASMLLYALLNLTGYKLPMEQLKQFRQWESMTPGHPEYGDTPGVETTTGPLGQGLANAVGMAIAERMLAARFNRPDIQIVDHHTYVFLGDGCLMEGISHEACSLAGRLGLGKLICLYDDNGISIDGRVDAWFGDDTPKRFEAYGWHVVSEVDGHDPAAIAHALDEARGETARPSLICCKTVIGYGSPNLAGSEETHGAPLGQDEIASTREALGWTADPFDVPPEILESWLARDRGNSLEEEWRERFRAYTAAYPEDAAEFVRRIEGRAPAALEEALERWIETVREERPSWATRKASGKTLEAIAPVVPELVSGSADLTGSNNTHWPGAQDFGETNGDGNYIRWGVREFAMCAGVNGMALHGGVRPLAGTFLVFSDYARNAIRLAAMMHAPGIFVLTHDSIGVGEDGPTHQPVEHAASLRLIPGVEVWRPCDAVETAVAWRCALEETERPSCLLLTRQGVPAQQHDADVAERIARGGYVLADCEDTPDCILIATGSEVGLAVKAREVLTARGLRVRVVSMPSTTRFERQSEAYRQDVLPAGVTTRLAIEAGSTSGWWKYVGFDGDVVGLDRFGASAPGGEVFRRLGFTVDAVVARIEALLEKKREQIRG